MKLYAILILFSLLVARISCVSYTWSGLGGDNLFSNSQNWAPVGNPSGSDSVNIPTGTAAVIVSSSVTVDVFTIASATLRLTVTNGATLGFNTDFITIGGLTIQVDQGASFISNNYVTLNGAVSFINFGVTSLSAIFSNGATISNVQNGNPVIINGQKATRFTSGNYIIPSGFIFDPNRLQLFHSLLGATTITFRYTETISNNNWQVVNDVGFITNFVFESGVNVVGTIGPNNTNSILARPGVTFEGTSTITNTVTWDVNPVFGNNQNPLIFNGGTLSFSDRQPTFKTPSLQGNSILRFTNTDSNNDKQVTFDNPISISNPNLQFSGRWATSGSDATFPIPFSLGSFSLTLNTNFIFQRNMTFSNGFTLRNFGTGKFTFTDLVTNNIGGTLDFQTNSVDAACNLPAKTFNFAGNSFTFTSGLVVKGCTVSAAGTLTINQRVSTDGGNTTLPSGISLQYVANTFTFAGVGTPSADSKYSITLTGTQTVPNTRTWTADNIELITSGTFSLQDTSSLSTAFASGGFFSINGDVSISGVASITATTAFASGTRTITTSTKINWLGDILLRNTILGGSGDVWFYGNLQVTKGLSNITNPNFRFKNAKTVGYQWDKVLPNSGALLTINSNGVTNTRILEGGITAQAGVNVVFDDALTFNTTSTINGTNADSATGTPPGCVTFRTHGLARNTITATAGTTVTFGIFTFLNHTETHLQGTGNFTFNQASVWLQGNLNFPFVTGDSLVTFANPSTLNLFTDATVGYTVIFNSDLTVDDLDNNDRFASKTLTLSSSTTSQLREIRGLVPKANVVFGGNVLVLSTTAVNEAGYTQINGNSVILGASATWNNRVIFNGGATTISSQDGLAKTFTLGEVANFPTHGLYLQSGLTVNTPVTLSLQKIFVFDFANGASLGGSGIVEVKDTFFSAASAVSIAPQTLRLDNTTFVGSGSFTLNPTDGSLRTQNAIQATVPVTYPGSIFNQLDNTILSPMISFTANPVTIQGGTNLTIDNGATATITTNWINTILIIFNSPLSIQGTGTITGAGPIIFNNTLTLAQPLTLGQSITFGFNNTFVVAIQNANANLTLTGSTITAKGVVLPTGFIISTSPANNIQTIEGEGVINGNWVWTNSVKFGTLNITGPRVVSFDLYVKAGATACFVSGVTLTTGTFISDAAGGTLLIEPYLENNGQNTFGTALTTRFSRGSSGIFEFRGSVPMVINSTVSCEAQLQFTQNVIFGWINATASNAFTLKTFCTNWFNTSATIQLWRNTLTINSDTNTTVYPQVIFGMNNTQQVEISVQTNGNQRGSILFLGDITIFGNNVNFNEGAALGAIRITTLQNSTLQMLTLTGPINFVSTTSPWVEPTVTFRNGLSQTLTLTGPIRLDNPTFNSGTGFVGALPSRLAITSGFIASSSFVFNVPVQFYVNAQGQTFSIVLQNFGTVVRLGYSPSLFNPVFLSSNFPLNLKVTGNTNDNNRFYLFANSSFTLGNIDVPSGVFQLSSSQSAPQTITARDITIGGDKGTFWVDNVNVNAQTVTFADATATSTGSVFQFTVSSLNPPRLTVSTAYYRGSATVTVSNFDWNGNAVTAIQATRSFQTSLSTPFSRTSGTPGFRYTSARNNEDAQFLRSANPTVVPFPTQSNGPSPAVSGSSLISINMFIVALLSALMFFF